MTRGDDEQTALTSRTDFERLSRGMSCAAPAVGGGGSAHSIAGVHAGAGELVALVFLALAFIGAGAWMFRRYGARGRAPRVEPVPRSPQPPTTRGSELPAYGAA